MLEVNRNNVDWKGYIPAISTPFLANGEIDFDGWETLLNWLVDEGMHGIVINGTTGEWFSQSYAEQKRLFETVVLHINGRIPVIAGCSGYTAKIVVENAKLAVEAGMSGIIVTPPPYIVLVPDEIVQFYEYISDNVDIPICVYNWPRGTNVDLTVETVKRLSQIERVVAIKNSTPNMDNFIETFYAVKDELRYFGFPMNEMGADLILNHGGDGTMGAGAVLGSDHPNFYNYLWRGDKETALKYGERDQFLFHSWFNSDFSAKFGSPQAIVKAALNLRGLPGGYPRAPLMPLNEPQIELVRNVLNQVEAKAVR
jgi:dihydrodipicolinate synthase/N-acetylneuraminate lyase